MIKLFDVFLCRNGGVIRGESLQVTLSEPFSGIRRHFDAAKAVWLLLPLWLGAIALCMGAMMKYESTSGELGVAANQWPQTDAIVPGQGRWTLVMFAHPRCPCTRASLSELAMIRSQAKVPVDMTVVFYRPGGSSTSWSESDLWKQAQKIPQVKVLTDENNQLAQLFDAHSSGVTFLYDPQQHLRYHGGITGSRGHEGNNPGEQTICALLSGCGGEKTFSPNSVVYSVFGCPLSAPTVR